MAGTHRIYLLSDQSFQVEPALRALLCHEDAVLDSYLERAYHALRHEIQQLPSSIRGQFPRVSSLADLLSRYRDGSVHPALEQCLFVIYHFASFIRYDTIKRHCRFKLSS